MASTRARVALPLGFTFLFQTLLTMAAYAIAVIAPDAAEEIGLRAESVGFLTAALYVTAMASGLASASVLHRLGPTATFQVLAALTALGVLALATSTPLTALLGAVLIGVSTGPMNPAGSLVLARVTPPVWQPFVFSVKQCGTPAGGMLAGAVLPPLAALYDWRLALCVLPAAAAVLILGARLGNLGGRSGPSDAAPSPRLEAARPASISAGLLGSLRIAVGRPDLLSVVLMGSCLGACQLAIATYFVVFLWSELGMTPIEAGRMFVLFHVSGIVARLILGAVAGRAVAAGHLLMGLGVVMGLACMALGTFTPETSTAGLLLVTCLLGATGNGWVGLFFAELARLAPAGQTAAVAGGGQFVMYTGIVLGPLAFGLLLEGFSYAECFILFAMLAASTAVMPGLADLGLRLRKP